MQYQDLKMPEEYRILTCAARLQRLHELSAPDIILSNQVKMLGKRIKAAGVSLERYAQICTLIPIYNQREAVQEEHARQFGWDVEGQGTISKKWRHITGPLRGKEGAELCIEHLDEREKRGFSAFRVKQRGVK